MNSLATSKCIIAAKQKLGIKAVSLWNVFALGNCTTWKNSQQQQKEMQQAPLVPWWDAAEKASVEKCSCRRQS